jgi:hypothetical protein
MCLINTPVSIQEKQRLVFLDINRQLRELCDAPISSVKERVGKIRYDLVRFHTLIVGGYDIEEYFGSAKKPPESKTVMKSLDDLFWRRDEK